MQADTLCIATKTPIVVSRNEAYDVTMDMVRVCLPILEKESDIGMIAAGTGSPASGNIESPEPGLTTLRTVVYANRLSCHPKFLYHTDTWDILQN